MTRQPDITKIVDKIISLNIEDPEKLNESIKEAAEKFIRTKKSQAEKNKVEADKKVVLLERLPKTEETILEIKRYEIEGRIWEKALDLRQERFYPNPSYIMEKNMAESGAFSVVKRGRGKTRNQNIEMITRKINHTTIRHFPNQELSVFDAKVLLVIQRLWAESGSGKELEIKLYQIAKMLNKPVGGQTYREIRDSLLSLFRAEIKFERFSINGEEKATDYIHILQGVGVSESIVEEENDSKNKTIRIRFSDYIYDSLQSGYFIYLSLAILEDLDSTVAQGLYMFIVSQADKGITDWLLDDLVTQLNITSPRAAKRQEYIRDACKEMRNLGIIRHFEIYQNEAGQMRLKISRHNETVGRSIAQLTFPL